MSPFFALLLSVVALVAGVVYVRAPLNKRTITLFVLGCVAIAVVVFNPALLTRLVVNGLHWLHLHQ